MLAASNGIPPFPEKMRVAGLDPVCAAGITVFQINAGKLCNQTCHHYHVDAGPDPREIMTWETAALCLAGLAQTDIPNVDITGGGPELNPNFRWLLEEAVGLRTPCDGPLQPHRAPPARPGRPRGAPGPLIRVEVIAALPYYRAAQTDAQRGEGVFEKRGSGIEGRRGCWIEGLRSILGYEK